MTPIIKFNFIGYMPCHFSQKICDKTIEVCEKILAIEIKKKFNNDAPQYRINYQDKIIFTFNTLSTLKCYFSLILFCVLSISSVWRLEYVRLNRLLNKLKIYFQPGRTRFLNKIPSQINSLKTIKTKLNIVEYNIARHILFEYYA